jgi:hypothetical protein
MTMIIGLGHNGVPHVRVDRNNGPHMPLFSAIHLGIAGNTNFHPLDVHDVAESNDPYMLPFSVIYLGIVGSNSGNDLLFEYGT